MSSYYEFQRQQASDQIKDRMNEAEAHRQAKLGRHEKGPSIRLQLLFPALLGVFIILLLLNGWTP